jgi:hypothetical protein
VRDSKLSCRQFATAHASAARDQGGERERERERVESVSVSVSVSASLLKGREGKLGKGEDMHLL